jgi:GcrA cell cycle regulator
MTDRTAEIDQDVLIVVLPPTRRAAFVFEHASPSTGSRFRGPKWTDERVSILRGFVAQEHSASQIARLMDCTRNAIIGKCHRLGLSLRGNEAPAKRRPREARPTQPAHYRAKKARALPRITAGLLIHPNFKQCGPLARKQAEPVPPVAPLNIGFMAAAVGQCRDITGTGADGLALFCGHPVVEGSSWCAHHHSVYCTAMRHPVTEKDADWLAGRRKRSARVVGHT